MKKSFLFVVLFLIEISFFEAKAVDCPENTYNGPHTTIIEACDSCYWEVEWCSSCFIPTNLIPLPIIKINSVVLKNHNPSPESNCACINEINTIDGPRPIIPWNAIIIGIIGSADGCFSDLPPIPNCNNGSSWQIKVTNGGCYRYINNLDGRGYYLCEEQPSDNSCNEFYEICLRFINGVFVPEIKSVGPPSPQFNCVNGCGSICQ